MSCIFLSFFFFLRRFKHCYFSKLYFVSFFTFFVTQSKSYLAEEFLWLFFQNVYFFIAVVYDCIGIISFEGFVIKSWIIIRCLEGLFMNLVFFFVNFSYLCLSSLTMLFFFSLFLFFVFFLNFLVFIFSFICVSVILNIVYNFFSSSIVGFFFFSKDFLTIEDEDIWLSYNIFHLDTKISQSKKMQVPLKHREIVIFFSLMKIFFDLPIKDLDYNAFAKDIAYLNLQKKTDLLQKKYSRSNKIIKKQSRKFYHYFSSKNLKTKLDFLDLKKFDGSGRLFAFYKIFFRDLLLIRRSKLTKLKRKKVFLRRKRLKLFVRRQRLSRLASIALMNKRIRKDVRISPFKSKSTQLFYNDFVRVKTKFLRRKQLKSLSLSKLIFLETDPYKLRRVAYLRYRSGFLNFFWFTLPFYLYKTNSFLIYFSNFGDLKKSLIVLYNSLRNRFSDFIFSLLDDYWETGAGMQFKKMKSDFRKTDIVQRALYAIIRSEDAQLDERNMVFDESAAEETDRFSQAVSFVRQGLYKAKGKGKSGNEAKTETKSKTKGGAKTKETGGSKKEESKNKSSKFKTKSGRRFKKFENKDDVKLKYISTNDIFLKRKFKKNSRHLRLRRRQQLMLLNRKSREDRLFYLGFGISPYRFYNEYNNSSLAIPKLKIIDLYKILEHFYFITTNDVDFFKTVIFYNKVKKLRQIYGQAIVNDLLEAKDHKQASKVSVNEHLINPQVSQFSNVEVGRDREYPSNDIEKSVYKNKYFKQSSLEGSSQLSDFTRTLLVSYKYRLKK